MFSQGYGDEPIETVIRALEVAGLEVISQMGVAVAGLWPLASP